MELTAYLSRIGYVGRAAPTIDTLRELQRLHISAIPFENLDVLLGRRIDMGPEAVERKLVAARRGGYCFEHNTLFRSVLDGIGFRTEAFLGRVRRNVPAEVRTGLTHTVLRVWTGEDERPWLVDVGFGSLGSPWPVRLDVDAEQATPLEPRRIISRDGALGFLHQARLGEEWVDLYEFTLQPAAPVDFEIGNWFSCTHPKAHFTNNLVVTRVDGTQRVSIFNREFVVRALDGSAERYEIQSPAELIAILGERFGLDFPADTVFAAPMLTWSSADSPFRSLKFQSGASSLEWDTQTSAFLENPALVRVRGQGSARRGTAAGAALRSRLRGPMRLRRRGGGTGIA